MVRQLVKTLLYDKSYPVALFFSPIFFSEVPAKNIYFFNFPQKFTPLQKLSLSRPLSEQLTTAEQDVTVINLNPHSRV